MKLVVGTLRSIRAYSSSVVRAGSEGRFFARSWFFPERTRKGLERAGGLSADVVVLDLERVTKGRESELRESFLEILNGNLLSGRRIFVRVSSVDNLEEVKQDLVTFTRPDISGFLLPKLKSHHQIQELDKILTVIEKEGGKVKPNRTKLVPILELPEAYFNSDQIASSSNRNACLMVGGEEFAAAAACEDCSPTYEAFFSRALIAAKAAGIEAVCGAHDRIDDHAGLERFCIKMKKSGFAGSVAFTPNQVHIINNAFSKTRREIMWSDHVLKEGEHNGLKFIQSSVQESRQLIGPAHRDKATFMRLQHDKQTKEFISETKATPTSTVKGVRMKKGLSKDIKLGEMVQTPLQVTISESWKSLWESAFLSTKGYFNRMPQSNVLGFDSPPLPFGLVATTAIAFSVFNMSCYARVHLSFQNMFQHRAVLSGDTVRAMFLINKLHEKKGGDGNEYCITDTTHWMVNQRDEVVFQVDKLTMYSPNDCNIDKSGPSRKVPRLNPSDSEFRKHLLEQPAEEFFPHFSVPSLTPGQLIIHDFVKIMGDSEVRMLCTLLNFIHPHHFNQLRYQATEILVPGPFVMSAALSGSAIDLGEVVHEDIPYCINPNKVNFGDQIGTVTFIDSCEPLVDNPHLEEITVRHLALKNTDMEILAEMEIPMKFFQAKAMKPSEYEAVCCEEFPVLLHKIVCVVDRRIVRVRPGYVKHRTYPPELK